MPAKTLALLVLCLCAGDCAPAAAAGAAVAPGDTVKVAVLGSEELSAQRTVDTDGTILLPQLGEYAIAGKSRAQAADEITEALRKYVKQPSVTVEITARAQLSVVVAGRVRKAGVCPIKPTTTVLEAIALAGGTETNADLSRVQLVRVARGTPEMVDIQAFTDGKNPSGNPLLRDGDVVVVPEKVVVAEYVFVLGEVKKPGQITFRKGLRLHEAIAEAGGATDMADPAATTLKTSAGDSRKLDLVKVLALDPAEDTVLAPSDTIYIPALTGSFNIYGAVTRPGPYPLKGQMMLTDALAVGGGYTAKAKPREVRILRGDGRSTPVSLTDIEAGKAQNVAIRPGDTIIVPESKDRTSFWQTITAIGSLGWLLW